MSLAGATLYGVLLAMFICLAPALIFLGIALWIEICAEKQRGPDDRP